MKNIVLLKGMSSSEVNNILDGNVELIDNVFYGMDYKHTWKCTSCNCNTFIRRWRGVREGRVVCERCRSIKLSGDSFYNIKILKGMHKDDVNSLISKWITLEDDVYLGADYIHNWKYPNENVRQSRWADIKNKSTMSISEDGCEYLNSKSNFTKEYLISQLRMYYNENGKVPTLEETYKQKYVPSRSYIESCFGSYKNALIEAGLFDKVDSGRFVMDITKEEIIFNTKKLIEEHLLNESVITIDDISNCEYLPKHTAVYKAFGSSNGICDIYDFLGYNVNDLKSKFLRKELKRDLVLLSKKLGRTPNSRDIDRNSKSRNIHSSGLYIKEFGSLYDAYVFCGIKPTLQSISVKITNEELINLLIDLSDKLGRTPTCLELEEYGVPSRGLFSKRFGGYGNALSLANLNRNKRRFKSSKGNFFNSTAEVKFANMLENNNVLYNSETYYKDVILNFKRKFRFDFDIEYLGSRIFIEIFGIQNNEFYENRKSEKIKICKDNNVRLVSFNWKEVTNMTESELYDYFLYKVNMEIQSKVYA